MEGRVEAGPRPATLRVGLFLLISVIVSAILGVIGHFVVPRAMPGSSPSVAWATAVVAFVASTGGWLIVLYGLLDDPTRVALWFGAGLLAKMVLIGFGVLATVATGVMTLEELLKVFVVMFLVLGFAQCGLVVKEAIKRSG